jgi:hypothetical protein
MNNPTVAAIDDTLHAIVERMDAFASRRGVTLDDKSTIVGHIRQYISLRHTHLPTAISKPKWKTSKPAEWTEKEEALWQEWVHTHCTRDAWFREIMYPVFGTNIWHWEPNASSEWRTELLRCLPWWLRRSVDIVQKFDPNPCEDEEAEANTEIGIDAYLLDHGSSKQKKRGFYIYL